MAEITNSALDLIATGYSLQFKEKGATHEGVLWASEEDQMARFQKLLDMVEADFPPKGITINDLGCGYGAFFQYIQNHPALKDATLYGYDISPDLIAAAKERFTDPRAKFILSHQALHPADYSFASGTFNFMGPQSEEEWNLYIKDLMRDLFKQSQKAMVFNMLDETTPVKDEWLYYANSEDIFTFCKKALSNSAKLEMNPELKGFTIAVYK